MDSINLQENIEEKKKGTMLNLGDGEQYEYKLQVDPGDMNMFENQDTTSKSVLREQTGALKTQLSTQLANGTEFAERRVTETDLFKNQSLRLVKDSRWYRKGDSPEMARVKKSMNYLNNFLDRKLSKYVTDEGDVKKLDLDLFKAEIDLAFDEAHAACLNYIEKKEQNNQARHTVGIRRRQKVLDLIPTLEQEKFKYDMLVEGMKMHSLVNYSVDNALKQSPRELSSTFKSSIVKDLKAEWQNQGNSTDVYKVTIVENNTLKTYYLKRNLPLISADIMGFLDRRTAQLETSRDRKISENADERANEEYRMKNADMSVDDYKNALDFLKVLKDKEKGASDAGKYKVRDRIIELFAHDFDNMFTELDDYNNAIRYMVNNKGMDWAAIANDPGNHLCHVAKLILEIKSNEAQPIAPGANPAEAPKPVEKTPLEWLIKKMGLKEDADADIITVLEAIHNKNAAKGLENLFRVSLGKEIELFGQMRDRSKGDKREQAAANNTGTYRMAALTGMTDVVTASDIRVVKFRDRDENIVEDFCTVTEAAEGTEFLDVLKHAQDHDMKIDYAPLAIRKLMRLQMLDTLCLQVDRHARNFKCVTSIDEATKRIVITDVMSYDHDMSFGEESLKDSFAKNDDGSPEYKGFLPPMKAKADKDSSLFNYMRKECFMLEPTIFGQIQDPVFRYPKYASNVRAVEGKYSMDALMLPFRSTGIFINEYAKNIEDESTHDGLNGDVYKIPADAQERKKFEKLISTPGRQRGGEELDKYKVKGKEKEQVSEELYSILKDIRSVCIRTDQKDIKKAEEEAKAKHKGDRFNHVFWYEKHFKTVYTNEEKKSLCRYVSRLKKFSDTYDLRFVRHTSTITKDSGGELDLWIQQFLFFFVNSFRDDEVVQDELLRIEGRYAEKQRKIDLFNSLLDEKGNIVMPAWLHYDLDAYNEIKKIADGERDAQMRMDLKAIDFSDNKIAMTKERAKEMIAEINAAKDKALAFYELMGWTAPPFNEFLLKKEDYEKFTSIDQLAFDPGKTYLSIDNQNYIYGNEKFSKYASPNELLQAYMAEAKKQDEPKRWNNSAYKNGMNSDERKINRIKNNPLRGKIVPGGDAGGAAA